MEKVVEKRIERLSEYMQIKGLNDNRVTVECELSRGLLGQARSGKCDLSNKTVNKILKKYQDINPIWLSSGYGEMFLDVAENVDTKTINEQLLLKRKMLKLKQEVLAMMFGVSRQTIANWESGKNIPEAKLPIVRKFIDNSNNMEEDNMNGRQHEENEQRAGYIYTETRPRLPMAATLGNIREYYQGAYRNECDEKPVIKQFSFYNFTMLVNTDSMAPYIDTGDVIACAEIGETIDYGHVYVIDTDGGALVKRVYQSGNNNKLKLISENPIYPEFLIDKSKIRGLYRVVGLLRVGI